MKTISLVSALLLLINLGACKCKHHTATETQQGYQLPQPVMDNNIDSLKQIQQHKRDSIKQIKKP